jgi:hypothetical protein
MLDQQGQTTSSSEKVQHTLNMLNICFLAFSGRLNFLFTILLAVEKY